MSFRETPAAAFASLVNPDAAVLEELDFLSLPRNS
jgi:hypothetical protein